MERTVQENLSRLALVPENSNVTLMMRHSERFEIPKGELGTDILLTEKGKEFAKKYGEMLPFPIAEILTSPIQRCVDTGECLLSGQNNDHYPVTADQKLGIPGVFITDMDIAVPYLLEHGIRTGFLDSLNKENPNGMEYLKTGADKLLQMIFSSSPDNGVKVMVTHDNVLSFVLSYLFEQSELTDDFWPDVLETAVFWQNGSDYFVAWRDQTLRINQAMSTLM